jgi:hypothetical protein
MACLSFLTFVFTAAFSSASNSGKRSHDKEANKLAGIKEEIKKNN